MPTDPVALLTRAKAILSLASAMRQSSDCALQFAAKSLPDMAPEDRAMRLTILRMSGGLMEQELLTLLDDLCEIWTQYRTLEPYPKMDIS